MDRVGLARARRRVARTQRARAIEAGAINCLDEFADARHTLADRDAVGGAPAAFVGGLRAAGTGFGVAGADVAVVVHGGAIDRVAVRAHTRQADRVGRTSVSVITGRIVGHRIAHTHAADAYLGIRARIVVGTFGIVRQQQVDTDAQGRVARIARTRVAIVAIFVVFAAGAVGNLQALTDAVRAGIVACAQVAVVARDCVVRILADGLLPDLHDRADIVRAYVAVQAVRGAETFATRHIARADALSIDTHVVHGTQCAVVTGVFVKWIDAHTRRVTELVGARVVVVAVDVLEAGQARIKRRTHTLALAAHIIARCRRRRRCRSGPR